MTNPWKEPRHPSREKSQVGRHGATHPAHRKSGRGKIDGGSSGEMGGRARKGELDQSKGAPVSLLPLLVIGMRCRCEKVRCRQLESCSSVLTEALLGLPIR